MKNATFAWVLVASFASLGAGRARAEALCDAPPPVREALAALNADEALTVPARTARLSALVEKYPDDVRIHEALGDLQSRDDYASALAKYRALSEKHPDDPRFAYLHARLLANGKPKEAVPLLQAVVARDSSFGRAYLLLGRLALKANDPARAKQDFEQYLKVCPDALDVYGFILRGGDRPSLAPTAARLRRTIESRQDAPALAAYATLWSLEFKSTPLTGHKALRKRVESDLKRLRALQPSPDEAVLHAFEEGYKLTSDAEGKKWVAAQQKDRPGAGQHAFMKVYMDWMKEHPFPTEKSTKKQVDDFNAAQFAASAEWVSKWPRSDMVWGMRLGSAPASLPVAELKAIATHVLELYPDTLQVAQVYAERGIDVDKVPGMVQRALQHHDRSLANWRAQPEIYSSMLPVMDEQEPSYRFGAWSTLARAYSRLGDTAHLREVVAQMKGAVETPADAKQDADGAQRMRDYWQARAWLASAEHHKADAFAFLLRARPPGAATDETEPSSPTREARQIWKELGGSDEAWGLLSAGDATKTASTPVDAGWQKREQPLPAIALGDLHGRIWRSSDLRGKVVILTAWATWCEPCKRELPYVEKLYQQARKRSDLLVLTLNVDDEAGLVEPFVREARYSFPVLLASDLKTSLMDRGIPLGLVVDATGTIRLERLGWDESHAERWVEDALAAAGRTKTR
jgi:thiol-disulfide isomerase/thioredoxin/tetratricopeptide (TPR) repeat protein